MCRYHEFHYTCNSNSYYDSISSNWLHFDDAGTLVILIKVKGDTNTVKQTTVREPYFGIINESACPE